MIIKIQGSEIRTRKPLHTANTHLAPSLVKLVAGAENVSLDTSMFTPRNEKLDLGDLLQEKKAKQSSNKTQKTHLCNTAPYLQTHKKAD
jgi:hypothetical protein